MLLVPMLPVALVSGVVLVVPAVLPGIELLLPVPEAPVVVCVAVVPLLFPTGTFWSEEFTF